MKKRKDTHLPECVALLLLAVLFAAGTAGERTQQGISDRVIRLHVSAASDEEADQADKLMVRDAVLAEASELLKHAGSREEALTILYSNRESLAEAGRAALHDPESQVRAEIRRELFGTRYYDNFALPGGYYDTLRVTIGSGEGRNTLRVTIGSGEGRNWWCVVYPQICAAATTDQRDAVAVMGGLTKEQISIMAQEEPEYQFRFRSIELLENILGWFRTGRSGIPESR